MALLTLLTDFGLDDYYVAAVKGTVLRLAPSTQIVDLAHTVPPGDVELASFLLAAAAPSFASGTFHLAVVDPGVGSSRRLLVATRGGQTFLAPDNGLLDPLLDGAEVFSIERADLHMPSGSATFHGRDRFAPAAAALLNGAEASDLGPPARDPMRLDLPRPERGADGLVGRVVHVDRFGNLVTDLPSQWLAPDRRFEAILEGVPWADRLVGCYDEIARDEMAVLPGSIGTLELSLRGDSAARLTGFGRGTRISIRFR